MAGLNLVKGQRYELNLTHVRVGLKWPEIRDVSNSFVKKEEEPKGWLAKALQKGKEIVNNAMEGAGEERPDFDIDSSVLQLTNGKLPHVERLVYYKGPIVDERKHIWNENRSIHHYGDNRTGGSAGDDEIIDIDLNALPFQVDELEIVANIYECMKYGYHFGMVQGAYIRLINPVNDEELCRFNLTDLYGFTALDVARIYKNESSKWMFEAKGIPTKDHDLQALIRRWM